MPPGSGRYGCYCSHNKGALEAQLDIDKEAETFTPSTNQKPQCVTMFEVQQIRNRPMTDSFGRSLNQVGGEKNIFDKEDSQLWKSQ